MPSSRISLATAALAGILALASATGGVLFAAGLTVVLIVFALGAVRSSALPSARPAAWLSLATGVGALVWLERDGTPDVTPVLAVLGPAVLVAILIQLLRRDGRPGLNRALGLLVSACVMAALATVWLAAYATVGGTYTVGLGLLGVGTVALAEALPVSRAVRRVLGVLAASTCSALLVVAVESVEAAVPAVSAVVIASFTGVLAAVSYAAADRLAGETSSVESSVVSTEQQAPERAMVPAGPRQDAAADAIHEPRRQPSGPVGAAAITPLRVAAPFVAAAPAVFVLGQLLVR